MEYLSSIHRVGDVVKRSYIVTAIFVSEFGRVL
jgi:hypothetical protein